MKPSVSIIMGSTSDLPVMRKAADFLNSMQVPFEMLALSAHRTPDEVADFARGASARGVRVIIAGAGMAAALPGVIAAITELPVIGVPLSATLQGQDGGWRADLGKKIVKANEELAAIAYDFKTN